MYASCDNRFDRELIPTTEAADDPYWVGLEILQLNDPFIIGLRFFFGDQNEKFHLKGHRSTARARG